MGGFAAKGVQASPTPPRSRQSRSKRRVGLSEGAVAGTDEEEEFADMSEKELRFHKYAELKAQWEEANGRIVPASTYSMSKPVYGREATLQNGRTKPKKSGLLN